MRLGLVVEGHGDVAAVPVLIRRMCDHLTLAESTEIAAPHRIARSKLNKMGELERAVELVARQTGPGAPILVLVDADDDCPATLGRMLLARVSRSDRAVAVVLAKMEIEAWFIAAANSLRGRRGLPVDLTGPANPEAIRDAKGWLGARMPRGYSEILDQPAFSSLIDLDQAAGASSFRKLGRDLRRLLRPARPG